MNSSFSKQKDDASYQESPEHIFSVLEGLKPVQKGCLFKGKIYPYNTYIAMNRQMIKTYEIEHGKKPDEKFYVLMQCKYLVEPLSHDHPVSNHRKFVWVSGQ
jgi:hypothetical protein